MKQIRLTRGKFATVDDRDYHHLSQHCWRVRLSITKGGQMRNILNPSYECPKCDEWVEILPTTQEKFNCPWCGEALRLSSDAEFEGGMWHDLSRLVTAGSHWDDKV